MFLLLQFHLYFPTGAAESKASILSSGEPIIPVFQEILDTYNVPPQSAADILAVSFSDLLNHHKASNAFTNCWACSTIDLCLLTKSNSTRPGSRHKSLQPPEDQLMRLSALLVQLWESRTTSTFGGVTPRSSTSLITLQSCYLLKGSSARLSKMQRMRSTCRAQRILSIGLTLRCVCHFLLLSASWNINELPTYR